MLGVLVCHIGPQDHDSIWMQPIVWLARLGWTGVDLFFVLSGFLITGILVANRTAHNYFRAFYWHRTLRIFPLYFLLLALVSILALLAPDVYRSSVLVKGDVWPYWAFLSNLRPFFDIAAISYLLPTWSLAVEEQFYVSWSAIAKFVNARTLAAVAIVVLCMTVSLRCWLMSQPSANPGNIFYFTFTHLDGLCIGAIIRIIFDSGKHGGALLFVARNWWLPALILGGILYFDWLLGPPSLPNSYKPLMMRGGLTAISWLYGALLLHGILIDGWVRWITGVRLFQSFGKYSFCIYLFQNPVLISLTGVAPWLATSLGTFWHLVVQIAIMYLVGYLSYRFIERPLLGLKPLVPYSSRKAILQQAPAH
ncbi:acyltransferase [Bradyrhizobium sp. BR 10261]|nr:acyltransferase [Bradyrhizobium sp. BR 10261]